MTLRIELITLLLGMIAVPSFAQPAKEIVKIAGSTELKLVLFRDGTVGGWGDTRDGQLGPRAAIPGISARAARFVSVALPGKAIDIAACSRTSYALLENGTVVAWGFGGDGELGCGEPCRAGSETPRQVTGLTGVSHLAGGYSTAFAIHSDGTVSAWGSHGSGMFGDGVDPGYLGQTKVSLTPVKLSGITGIAQVSVGGGHVLAVTTSGRVLAWGKLPYGRVYADDPVEAVHEVAGLTDVAQVEATSVAVAVKKDGTVWVWGHNAQAQFGNGHRTLEERTRIPLRVPGVSNIVSLAGGSNGRHFVGLRRDGTVVAWGNSDLGQTGTGLLAAFQPSPATVSLRNVKSVFASGANSFAIDASGQLWIWGSGSVYGAWPMRPNAKFPLRLNIPEGIAAAPAPATSGRQRRTH